MRYKSIREICERNAREARKQRLNVHHDEIGINKRRGLREN
jgi:hypothetical protein